MSGIRVRPLPAPTDCDGRMTAHGTVRPCRRRATVRVTEAERGETARLCGLHMRSAIARDTLAGVLWEQAT